MKYNFKGLNELSYKLLEFQIEKGFTNNDTTKQLIQIHSEVSEAFDAFKKDKFSSIEIFERNLNQSGLNYKEVFEIEIKNTFEDELADILLRTIALCGKLSIDIEKHMELKMNYNELHEHQYGGKDY